jgi:acyl-CoA hydrolase
MEIFYRYLGENRESGTKPKPTIYTFVAVDDTGRPIKVPQIIP